MSYNDYVFLLYIDQFYDHKIFDKIMELAQKGMSLKQRKRAREQIKGVDKPKHTKYLILMYIIFKRRRENSYVDQLGDILFEDLSPTKQKKLNKAYAELQRIHDELKLPELEVTKQVISNIHRFTTQTNQKY